MQKTIPFLGLFLATAVAGQNSAWAGCPATGATLLQTAAEATQGFEDRDADGVEDSVGQLREELLCVSTVLDPAQAAAVHRAFALRAFLTGNSDATRSAFSAARAADPSYQLPADLVPDGHPMRDAFDSAGTTGASTTEPLVQRAGLRMFIDGGIATQRPTDRPAVLQADQAGVMVGSVYLLPEDALPGWASLPPETVAVTPATPAIQTEPTTASTADQNLASANQDTTTRRDSDKRSKKDKNGPNKGLLFTGVGVGVASAGLWGLAVWDGLSYESHLDRAVDDNYRDQDEIDDAQTDIDGHAQRVNILGYAAQATTATAGTLLVASFVF